MKLEKQFSEIILLIKQAQSKAIKAANTELIALYWQIGEHISKRIETEELGEISSTKIGIPYFAERTRSKRIFR